jgi:threonine-phosphate decarboxylase
MTPQREPWQVNVLAEAAARAAINAKNHHQRTREFVQAERCWFSDQLAQLPGLWPVPGTANYLLAWTAQDPAPMAAWLAARRVLIRNCTHIPGVDASAIRVAVRTRPDNERLLELLKEYLCAG